MTAQNRPTYEKYDCSLNTIGVGELFERYVQTRFLYPDKLERVSPWMGVIIANWEKALKLGDDILQVITYDDSVHWGSLTSWRHTMSGWLTQHLAASGGGGVASRAVMMAGQEAVASTGGCGTHDSHQNWFKRTNPFANKVFGAVPSKLGANLSCIRDCDIFRFPVCSIPRAYSGEGAIPEDEVRAWFDRVLHPVFIKAEGLDQADLKMRELDDIYSKARLRRYREVFAVAKKDFTGVAGVALAYRGPLGLNLTFLENRCDVLLDPSLGMDEAMETIRQLLSLAATVYSDFELGWIPVIVNSGVCSDLMPRAGGEKVVSYAQCCWLKDGYREMIRHLNSVFDLSRRSNRPMGKPGDVEVPRKSLEEPS